MILTEQVLKNYAFMVREYAKNTGSSISVKKLWNLFLWFFWKLKKEKIEKNSKEVEKVTLHHLSTFYDVSLDVLFCYFFNFQNKQQNFVILRPNEEPM